MTPSKINTRIVIERINWIEKMAAEIRSLPLDDFSRFNQDSRNVWTAESCLRRGLEALMDLGRHILSKGFGVVVSEYKEIAESLKNAGVLNEKHAELMKTLAGYRNRMVHFYHQVTPQELYGISRDELDDLLLLADSFRAWLKSHPEKLEQTL
jgi:uncharacterized protein YutE (UPF0331/DUF86 family)